MKVRKKRRSRPRAGKTARGESDLPSFTLMEVAEAVGGRVVGGAGLRLTGLESLDRATPRDLSWVADSRRTKEAAGSGAGALLVVNPEEAGGRPCVVVERPTLAMAIWLSLLRRRRPRAGGVSRRAHVDPTARLAADVCVAPGATIQANARVGARTVVGAGAHVGAEAEIGEDCLLHPLAVILDRCQVGSRCVFHPGSVVGSDGFGYVWDGKAHFKIPQGGIVRIEDDVEVGANTTIDRATFGETVIGRGTKIDNLVQVGHNVVIGEHSILCGQAGIGGSSRLGSGVTLAGQVGVSDHAEIGDGAVVTGQGGVVRGARVPPGSVVSGMPAAPHRDFLRSAAWLARLPELARRVEELEKRAASGRED